eukprot:763997-Hanusia_phi.AAC.4
MGKTLIPACASVLLLLLLVALPLRLLPSLINQSLVLSPCRPPVLHSSPLTSLPPLLSSHFSPLLSSHLSCHVSCSQSSRVLRLRITTRAASASQSCLLPLSSSSPLTREGSSSSPGVGTHKPTTAVLDHLQLSRGPVNINHPPPISSPLLPSPLLCPPLLSSPLLSSPLLSSPLLSSPLLSSPLLSSPPLFIPQSAQPSPAPSSSSRHCCG